jgi:hypothetical protein
MYKKNCKYEISTKSNKTEDESDITDLYKKAPGTSWVTL